MTAALPAPAHWRAGQIKHVAVVTLGKMLQSASSGSDLIAPYLRAANVQPNGVLRLEDRKTMYFGDEELAALDIRAGDVVVVEGGIGGFGRAAYVRNDLSGWGFQNSINRLRPLDGVDGRFLTYYLLAQRARGFIAAYCNIVSMPHLTAEKLASMPVSIPPAGEQRMIADYLDHEMERIDDLVAKQMRLIANLRERRAAVIADVLVRAGGEATKLKRLAKIQTGLTLSGDGDPGLPEWPYLRVANVQAGFVDTSVIKTVRASVNDAAASTLRAGDVLMTEGGDIDKLGRGSLWDGLIDPCLHQNHVFAVRPRPDLDPRYLIYLLDGEQARTYFRLTAKKTTNLASTSKWTVGNLPIVVPSPENQRAVVCDLDERTTMIDVLIGKAERFIELAGERRVALMTAAVTGKINVGNPA